MKYSLIVTFLAIIAVLSYNSRVSPFNKMDRKQIVVTILLSFIPVLNALIVGAVLYDIHDEKIKKRG